MQFLIISQRALTNPNYKLNNLTGHGRIDILFRSILAANRILMDQPSQAIHCYMKGIEPHGWITIQPGYVQEEDDEISIAARVQEEWSDLFTEGDLSNLLNKIDHGPLLLLEESGEEIDEIDNSSLIILGAQIDLTRDDIKQMDDYQSLSLGPRSLLASQAITYLRQKVFIQGLQG